MKPVLTTEMLAQAYVASRAEAWIETGSAGAAPADPLASPPARRRGLKPKFAVAGAQAMQVASRAEAWIETATNGALREMAVSRLPRGGVD